MALTDHGAEDYEPFHGVAVVRVEGRRVDAPSECAREKSVRHPETIDKYGRKNAAETHEGEDDTVAGINLGEAGSQ